MQWLKTFEEIHMIKATINDKPLILDILTLSFEHNRSVNYIIPQDRRRMERIRNLMEYSFEMCYRFGRVYLSENRKAVALILFPDKVKTTVSTVLLDARLIGSALGLSHLKKAMAREKKIKALQPAGPLYYLWFIGVHPSEQGKGLGRTLLHNIIEDAAKEERLLCLETSTPGNVPWYNKSGFDVYNQLDLGYTIYFLKRDPAF